LLFSRLNYFHPSNRDRLLPYGELDAITNAVGYAKFFSRLRDGVIRVYDEAGKVIERHEQRERPKEKDRSICDRT
jgi:hypothetical protein